MELRIILTIAVIYGGVFLVILACAVYAICNLKMINKNQRDREQLTKEILKNSNKITKNKIDDDKKVIKNKIKDGINMTKSKIKIAIKTTKNKIKNINE